MSNPNRKRKSGGSRYQSDDDDYGGGGRGGNYLRHNLRQHKTINYREMDDGDDEEEEQGPGWNCENCTLLNKESLLKCEGCGHRRPASTRRRTTTPEPFTSGRIPKRASYDEGQSGEEEELDFGMNDFTSVCYGILNQLEGDPRSAPFCPKVDESYAPGYYETIHNPIWIKRIRKKVKQGLYKGSYQVG